MLEPNAERFFKISASWINKLLRKYNLADRKGGHDSQKLPENWEALATNFHQRIANSISTYNIPSSLVLGADEYPIPLLATHGRTRVMKGNKILFVLKIRNKICGCNWWG